MAVLEIEVRVATLEAEVKRLKRRLDESTKPNGHWVDRVYGAFAGDSDFLQAMRLGRKYRKSLRPKPPKHARKRPSKQVKR